MPTRHSCMSVAVLFYVKGLENMLNCICSLFKIPSYLVITNSISQTCQKENILVHFGTNSVTCWKHERAEICV